MQKIIVNRRYGGFGFSNEAVLWLRARGYEPATTKGNTVLQGEYYPEYIWEGELVPPTLQKYDFQNHSMDNNRTHPLLIECIETLGEKANGDVAKLEIVEIPDDVEWEIEEYDGYEHIAEIHRTW